MIQIPIRTTVTLDIINQIPYGLSSRGQHKLFKVRYTIPVAQVLLSHLTYQLLSDKKVFKMYVTKKGFVILSFWDHQDSKLWSAIRYAQICAMFAMKARTKQLKLGI